MVGGALACGVVLVGSAAQMDVGELEARLKAGCGELRDAFERDPSAYRSLARKCEQLRPAARELARLTGIEVSRRVPGIAAVVKARSAPRRITVFREAQIVLYGKVTETQVLSLWQGQLRACILAAYGLMDYDQATVKEWMMAWVEGKKDRRSFFRAEQVRDCLEEVQKLCGLLSLPGKVVRVSKGEVLFEDDFSEDLSNWYRFGGGDVTAVDGKLHARGAGITVWCRREFGNALVSFEYHPRAAAGSGAGALFAYPGTPVKGKDYSASAGPMVNYNYGIVTYHCSLYRGQTGRTNLRRTGSGLKMLSTVMPDPCAQPDRTYRVEMLKLDETIQVYVDGRLIHSYVDAGVYGPPPEKGRFGIRHFSAKELNAFYDDFQVFAVSRSN